jgi:ribonuclease HI
MKYLEKVREMEKHFKGYSVQHIPRDDNNEADKLAKAAARNQELPPDVFFEIIREPSIKDSRPKNRECSGDSRLESGNHGLSERPL